MNFLQLLEQKLKAKGMPVVENLAEQVYAAVKEAGLEAAAQSGNPLVIALVPVGIQALDGLATSAIDKIDGQPG